MEKILVILKGSLSKMPPVLSICLDLADLGYNVSVFTQSSSEYIENIFKQKHIKINYYKENKFLLKIPFISKIYRWLDFKRQTLKYTKRNKSDYLFIASADTALALGKTIFNHKYFLQVHELYDTVPFYKKHLKPYMQNALKVIVPQEMRAKIFRDWYNLKETPVVLPNKPYFHPQSKNIEITDNAVKEAFNKIPKGSKIIFYQGIINYERDLRPIAAAIQQLGLPWCLAVQAPISDNIYYKDLFSKFGVYKIPYVKAPKHLEITSYMHIGLVFYNHISMNNEYCAPNKIYEYSGFGMPMLANDVAGLKDTVGKYQAGLCLNLDNTNVEQIKDALFKIDKDYETYSQNAKRFYVSIDRRKILAEVFKL